LALLVASGGALAGAGTITTTVTPLSTTVTYSTETFDHQPVQTFYVGYTVSFTNTSKNTINNVSFRGTTTVVRGTQVPPELVTAEIAPFISAEGWTCSVQPPMAGDPINAVTISCPLGSFTKGQTKDGFTVFFKSPVSMPVSNPLTEPTHRVHFAGLAVTAEGYNGPNSWNNSLDAWTALPDVTLGTTTPNNVTTVVPGSTTSKTFFTGDGSDPSVADPITTKVTIPPLPRYTTANLFEQQQTSCANPNNFVTCYQSALTIPGHFSPYLTIVLRQDASTFKPTYTIPSINSVVVTYEYVDALNQPQTYTVGPCASPTTPLGNDLPCIASKRSTVTASNTSQVCTRVWIPIDHGKGDDANHNDSNGYWSTVCTPLVYLNLSGFFEWVIINTKNGLIKLQ